jgi:lipoyl-dependent peroxiredoxin
MPVRTSTARWNGTLTEGNGTMAFGSGAFEGQYSFSSRFEEGTGTNPEELIGAAHAGCFSMAFSGGLVRAGFTPDYIETTAKVHVDKDEGGFTITRSELSTRGSVPDIDEATFQKEAEAAKAGCPVSRALAGVEISLDAQLV